MMILHDNIMLITCNIHVNNMYTTCTQHVYDRLEGVVRVLEGVQLIWKSQIWCCQGVKRVMLELKHHQN